MSPYRRFSNTSFLANGTHITTEISYSADYYTDIAGVLSTFPQTIHDQCRIAALSLVLWSILTGFTAFTLVALKRRGLRYRSRRILAASILLLYILSALYWASLLVGVSQTLQTSIELANLLDVESDGYITCIGTIFQGGAADTSCLNMPEYSFGEKTLDFGYNELSGSSPVALASYISPVAFALSVAVGDAIVWWRAWVIWSATGKRVILALAIFAVASVITAGVTAPVISGGGSGLQSWFSLFGIAASGISFLSNVFTTSLIAYKAWEHRRTLKANLDGQSSTTQAQRILTVLAESGVVYCIFWAATLSIQTFGIINPQGTELFYTGTDFDLFFEGALPMLVAMYPTIIVLLVSLQSQHGIMHFTQQTASEVLPVAIPLRRISVTSLGNGSITGTSCVAASSTDSLPVPSPTFVPRTHRRMSVQSFTLTRSIMGDARLRQYGIDHKTSDVNE